MTMTTSTETDPSVLSVSAGAVARIVGAVLPHAVATDDMSPMAHVRLEITGTDLVAVATNRYTLAVARTPVAGPAGVVAYLDRGAAAELVHAASAAPDAAVDLSPIVTPSVIDPEGEEDGARLVLGEQAVWATLPPATSRHWRWPSWRTLLRTALNGSPPEDVAVNPALVQMAIGTLVTPGALLSAPPGMQMEIRRGRLLVTSGDWYVALVVMGSHPTGYPSPADLVHSLTRQEAP